MTRTAKSRRYFDCWKCKQTVPVLTEKEAKQLADLDRKIIQGIKVHTEEAGERLSDIVWLETYKSALQLHEDMTGSALKVRDENAQRVIQHSYQAHGEHQLGPDCPDCGVPLRTFRASYCANCGRERNPH